MATEDTDHGDIRIQFIPHAYDKNDSEASALRLLYALYPDWKSSAGQVKFKRFTEGVMNTVLFQCLPFFVPKANENNTSSS